MLVLCAVASLSFGFVLHGGPVPPFFAPRAGPTNDYSGGLFDELLKKIDPQDTMDRQTPEARARRAAEDEARKQAQAEAAASGESNPLAGLPNPLAAMVVVVERASRCRTFQSAWRRWRRWRWRLQDAGGWPAEAAKPVRR